MAKQEYKPGDLVLEDLPYVHALNLSKVDKVCDKCLRSFDVSDLRKCSRCRHVRYCSRDCQTQAWKEHRDECKLIKKLMEEEVIEAHWTNVLIMLRIYLKLKRGEDGATTMPDGSLRSFHSLMSKEEDIEKTSMAVMNLLIAFKYLGQVISMVWENRRILADIYGMVGKNKIYFGDNFNHFGIALYIKAAIFDHSCRPNAMWSFEDGKISVRAIQDIPDIDHVRTSYMPMLDSIMIRRIKLKYEFFFRCECDACAIPSQEELRLDALLSDGANCPKCSTDMAVDSKCPKCNHEVDSDFLRDFRRLQSDLQDVPFQMKFREEIQKGQEGPKVEVIKNALTKVSLYNHDMIHFMLYNLPYVMSIENGYEAALRMVDVLKEVMVSNDLRLADYLRRLATAELGIGLTSNVVSRTEEALKICSICLGSEHKLTQDLRHAIDLFRNEGL